MKIHIIKKGETLYALSKKYNVPLNELISMNPQLKDPNKLDIGTKIKVPSSSYSTGGHEVIHKHVVKERDTLWKLSKAWGVPLQTMIEANPQIKNPNVLVIGQVVNIPKVASSSQPGKGEVEAGGKAGGKEPTAPKSKNELTKPKPTPEKTPGVTSPLPENIGVNIPAIPNVPSGPNASKAPGIPNVPSVPSASKAPGIPNVPNASKAPSIPSVPSASKTPSIPNVVAPNSPVAPSTYVAPAKGGIPAGLEGVKPVAPNEYPATPIPMAPYPTHFESAYPPATAPYVPVPSLQADAACPPEFVYAYPVFPPIPSYPSAVYPSIPPIASFAPPGVPGTVAGTYGPYGSVMPAAIPNAMHGGYPSAAWPQHCYPYPAVYSQYDHCTHDMYPPIFHAPTYVEAPPQCSEQPYYAGVENGANPYPASYSAQPTVPTENVAMYQGGYVPYAFENGPVAAGGYHFESSGAPPCDCGCKVQRSEDVISSYGSMNEEGIGRESTSGLEHEQYAQHAIHTEPDQKATLSGKSSDAVQATEKRTVKPSSKKKKSGQPSKKRRSMPWISD
ncbi:LysM peptidoglycan-binding domain-containing protein [Paenibacillus sp. 481]|uniref:LysM peptidoglycan-binding domain-containing protein n=1 Tax=Paenibacillus sp. 481 TaxID=2835869 RepID=UPI001E54B5FF|nr:LysM peptidoglycan-binding domain-containing protein [Paenibacillus sp. 481]UHA74341.1 LysM peptidoglycan-binding domain-containing protein [Paenibacillus sp. 481]